jgi:Putative restriction endonuclease
MCHPRERGVMVGPRIGGPTGGVRNETPRRDSLGSPFRWGRKAALYASFGVRELWVIDAVKRATRVFRKPSAEGYGETLDFGESDLLTPEFALPEFALRLDELESL